MEIILLQDVKNLGKVGELVNVSDGYARNYLFPKKLAASQSPGVTKMLEAKRKKEALQAEKAKKASEELAKKISGLSLTLTQEAGVNDTLFGSVTADTIFHALHEEDIHVDKKNINIAEPIRKLGIYNVEVKLHPEIKANLRVWVVKK